MGMLYASTRQKDLAGALEAVRSTVPSRSTILVLQAVLLTAKQGWLTLTTTDLEAATSVTIPAQGVQEGAALVPHKQLQALVKAFAGVPDLALMAGQPEAVDSVFPLSVQGATVLGHDPAEYPAIDGPRIRSVETVHLERAELALAFEQVIPAMAKDDTRSVMHGLLLKLQPDGSAVVTATDGFRIHTRTISGQVRHTPLELNIPYASAKKLLKLFKTSKDAVSIDINWSHMARTYKIPTGWSAPPLPGSGQEWKPIPKRLWIETQKRTIQNIVVRLGNTSLTTRVDAGRFPDYTRLFTDVAAAEAANAVQRLIVRRDDITTLISRSRVFTNECRIYGNPDGVIGMLTGLHDGPACQRHVTTGDVHGGPVNVALNLDILEPVIKAIPTERVEFVIRDVRHGIEVRPWHDAAKSFRGLVMPLAIRL
jgi:DNA polymerase III sliding clamp (beta) subunit (PCNA family)